MAYTYDEIRELTVAILSGSERTRVPVNQFVNLCEGIQEALSRRTGSPVILSQAEQLLMVDAVWDLFRDGELTFGVSVSQPGPPFFRLRKRSR